jgi:hypothetical protein
LVEQVAKLEDLEDVLIVCMRQMHMKNGTATDERWKKQAKILGQ